MTDLSREERAAAVAAGRAAYEKWRSIPNREAYLDMWFAAAGAEGAQAALALRAIHVSDTEWFAAAGAEGAQAALALRAIHVSDTERQASRQRNSQIQRRPM